MADLCLTSTNPTGCGHYDVTGVIVGVSTTIHVHDSDLLVPLTADERETLMRLTSRVLRQTGVTLSQFVGRILRGDEATNVKLYDIIGAGSAVTKTNIGSAYVDVLPGLNAQCMLVDFTGCTEMRIRLGVNVVGTGPVAARLVRDGDSAVIFEATNVGAPGERDADTDWIPIPNGVTGQTLVRIQAKSAVAADDPVFRRCSVGVR